MFCSDRGPIVPVSISGVQVACEPPRVSPLTKQDSRSNSVSRVSFAEMISGVPIFRGRDNNDQLNQIIRVLGTPDDRTMRKIMQDSASRCFIHGIQHVSQLTDLSLAARGPSSSTAPIPSSRLARPNPASSQGGHRLARGTFGI